MAPNISVFLYLARHMESMGLETGTHAQTDTDIYAQNTHTHTYAQRPINRQTDTDQQTDRQTDRQTIKQTDRQTIKQTDRQTDNQTDRQTIKQTDRQTDRQTDNQADRQTDNQTDRQKDRQSNRQTDRRAHRITKVERYIWTERAEQTWMNCGQSLVFRGVNRCVKKLLVVTRTNAGLQYWRLLICCSL